MKKNGLTTYSTETCKAVEEKRANPLCPYGHKMNFEPMNTLEEVGPIYKKLERLNRMRPGTILSGQLSCPGCNANNFADISYGWHMCDHRVTGECRYLTRCNDCFNNDIAGP
jgi:hypothetical protein